MANDPNKQYTEIPWWAIVLGFILYWPVGMILLFLSLGGVRIPTGKGRGSAQGGAYRAGSGRVTYRHDAARKTAAPGGTAQAPSGAQTTSPGGTAQAAAPKAAPGAGEGAGTGSAPSRPAGLRRLFQPPKSGKVMTVAGAAMTLIFGLGFVEEFTFALRYGILEYAAEWVSPLGLLCAGVFMLCKGAATTRRARRARLYQGAIGQRQSVFLADLAAAAGVSEKRAVADLQRMLSDGALPAGYIDRASGRLVLTDQGFQPPETASRQEEEKPGAAGEEADDAILRQIREVNEAIPDAEMTRKIRRIEEITGKILDYQKKNPAKAGELRQFLNYYLPTTLKILNAYAQMDAQGVEGKNITAAKRRIEGMMDKVVEGFEKQLDQLFQADAMDITADVEVLERMLDKDGLGEGLTMTQGGR